MGTENTNSHVNDKDRTDREKEPTARQPPFLFLSTRSPALLFFFFLINTARVVRLCLIMHDRYQQQTPLNEAPLNGNTITPPGAQEERQDCFSSFLSVLISVRWEAAERGGDSAGEFLLLFRK